MKKISTKYLNIFLVLFLFAYISCNSPNEVPIGPVLPINTTPLDSIDFQQVAFDTVLIKAKNNLLLDWREIDKIVPGIFDNDVFIPKDTLSQFFETVDGKFRLLLNYRMSFPDTQLTANIGVKYLLADGSNYITRKNINLYEYPYPGTKLLLRWNEFILPNILHFAVQDFIYLPSHIYYHPLGPLGLYDYNITTKETRQLYDYGGGIAVGGNSRYIFIDYGHNSVYRYVLNKDTVDKKFDFDSLPNWKFPILGIACSDSLVFVSSGYPSTLYILSVDLQLLSSVDLNIYGAYSLAYYNNLLYAGDFSNNIRKINPGTGAVIDVINNLSINVEGISIYGDNLYFSDFTRKYIGYIPVKDVFPGL